MKFAVSVPDFNAQTFFDNYDKYIIDCSCINEIHTIVLCAPIEIFNEISELEDEGINVERYSEDDFEAFEDSEIGEINKILKVLAKQHPNNTTIEDLLDIYKTEY